ncbi:peptidase [Comamonas terrigena]|uniref:peptidase n=1 Tax=Comamonas terrigena TaxID=32013 RepID=UPI002449E2FC|nr:peptidase [Comamonas terrigena]MDH0050274.1 peptidase [Comamonas terrigena]
MQALHIFKPGSQTDLSGRTLEFTEADLAACAKAYDPALHEAPLVVGHPKHDNPAYGWVKSLSADAEGLAAEPQQVDAQFAELVGAGRFKKISASFYTPDSPNNPVPGSYYLRHVGFLGALPPAVKGLREVSFAEQEDGVVEFGDWGHDVNAGLWRRMREWLLTKFGQEAADQVVPDWQIESIREAAQQPADTTRQVAFAETSQAPAVASTAEPPPQENHVNTAEAAALTAENTQLKQQLADAHAQREAELATKRHQGNVSYAEALVAAGTLAPKHQAAVIAFLDFSEANANLEFGEGDAKQPLATAFKSFLGDLPKVVDFGEHATKDKANASGGGTTGTVSYGENVDQDRLVQDKQIRDYMQTHGVDYATAANHVIK